MTIDIKEGDLLVVASRQYPIKSCADWSQANFSTRAFRRMARLSASTKREPAEANGKQGDPVPNLSGLKCTPLDPVNAEIQKRVALDTPMELLQTFITDGDGFVHLVVEDTKA